MGVLLNQKWAFANLYKIQGKSPKFSLAMWNLCRASHTHLKKQSTIFPWCFSFAKRIQIKNHANIKFGEKETYQRQHSQLWYIWAPWCLVSVFTLSSYILFCYYSYGPDLLCTCHEFGTSCKKNMQPRQVINNVVK